MVASYALLRPLVVATLLACSTAAFGQTPPRLDEARAAFETGLGLAAQSRWAEALASFRSARELADRPSIAYNEALALQHLGRYVEARDTLQHCLSIAGADDADLVRDVRTLLTTVNAAVASVTVTLRPTTSVVRIDGTTTTIPASGTIEIDPGRHTFSATAQGHIADEQTMMVAPGARMSFVLAPRAEPAQLVVSVTPSEATIALDEAVLGRGSVHWAGPPGTHALRLSAAGYLAREESVSLDAGERRALSLTLRPRPVSVFERPLFWVGVGAGLAAVVTAVVLVAVTPPELQPDGGSTGRVFQP